MHVIEPDYVFNLCIFPLFIQTKNGESQRYANQGSAVPLTPKIFFLLWQKLIRQKKCHLNTAFGNDHLLNFFESNWLGCPKCSDWYTAGGFVWCDMPFYLVKQPQEKWAYDFHDDAPPLSFQLQVTEAHF